MRRYVSLVLCLLAALMGAQVAQADPVDDAVAALKDAPVYVAPGTEGTNSETAGVLMQQLNDGDNIVIVMLPASALAESGEDLSAMAKRIDDATSHKKIIGLSVGGQRDQAVGFSVLLPPGVATELMNNAVDVSTNSSETLSTFITNVHDWQAQNPDATASKPTAKKDEGWPWLAFLVPLLAVCLSVLAVTVAICRSRRQDPDQVKLRRSPDKVQDLLRQILDRRQQIDDHAFRSVLAQLCTDTEAYFDRTRKAGGNVNEDSRTFQNHLLNVRNVLDTYIDVQNSPDRYFDNPEELKETAVSSIADFEEFVIKSIKRGGRARLLDFEVDTQILQAQRYS